jgi:hypothetical protein
VADWQEPVRASSASVRPEGMCQPDHPYRQPRETPPGHERPHPRVPRHPVDTGRTRAAFIDLQGIASVERYFLEGAFGQLACLL